jgi:hypothetical protein
VRETDLAARIVAHLRDLNYEVHQEVAGADIVGKLGDCTWIVECKLGLGLSVLGQADKWARDGYAHFVSVATPTLKHDVGREFAIRVLRERGIGWLSVRRHDGEPAREEWQYPIEERIAPRLQRTAQRRRAHGFANIARLLNEHTASGYAVAGSPSPRSWTPFKQTCTEIRKVLTRDAGLTVREIVERVSHHYASGASARSRISHYLTHGIIEGVELHPGPGPMRWRLAAKAGAA